MIKVDKLASRFTLNCYITDPWQYWLNTTLNLNHFVIWKHLKFCSCNNYKICVSAGGLPFTDRTLTNLTNKLNSKFGREEINFLQCVMRKWPHLKGRIKSYKPEFGVEFKWFNLHWKSPISSCKSTFKNTGFKSHVPLAKFIIEFIGEVWQQTRTNAHFDQKSELYSKIFKQLWKGVSVNNHFKWQTKNSNITIKLTII